MSLINFSGIASGIDSSSLISALVAQERSVRIKPLEDKITELQDSSDAFSQLKELLGKLKSSVAAFRTISGGVLAKSVASSDETLITASATGSAVSGTYSITPSQLAKNATYSFKSSAGTYTSTDAKIAAGLGGADTVQVTIGTGSEQSVVNLDVDSDTSLEDFVTSFNNSTTKASAAIVDAGNSAAHDYRVVITSNKSGELEGQLAVSVGGTISGAGAFDQNTLAAAQNAEFQISGIGAGAGDTITRYTNSFGDVIPGVNITLHDESLSPVTITVSDDASSTASKIQDFVNAYNEVVQFISENDLVQRQESGSNVSNLFGPLASSSLDENLLSALRNALGSAGTSGREVNILSDLGITTQRDGTLAFDAAAFEDAVANDSEGVRLITQSLGDSLANTGGVIDQFTRFNGLIDQLTNSNNQQVSSYESRIADSEASLTRYEAALVTQYSRLESLIGQLNSQQSSLSAVLPK